MSRAGVTGTRDTLTRDAEILVRRIRAVSNLPVAVGFGIYLPMSVTAMVVFGAFIGWLYRRAHRNE